MHQISDICTTLQFKQITKTPAATKLILQA